MRTEKQILASQINGAKSNGPVTPEGKASSATNAARHRAYAATNVIPALGESGDQLLASVERWNRTLQPSGEIFAASKPATWNQLLDPSIDADQVAPLNHTILQYSRVPKPCLQQYLKMFPAGQNRC